MDRRCRHESRPCPLLAIACNDVFAGKLYSDFAHVSPTSAELNSLEELIVHVMMNCETLAVDLDVLSGMMRTPTGLVPRGISVAVEALIDQGELFVHICGEDIILPSCNTASQLTENTRLAAALDTVGTVVTWALDSAAMGITSALSILGLVDADVARVADVAVREGASP